MLPLRIDCSILRIDEHSREAAFDDANLPLRQFARFRYRASPASFDACRSGAGRRADALAGAMRALIGILRAFG